MEEVKLKHTCYTLEHVRAFGMYNYLHLDPWYEESVLFVDSKGRVLCLTITLVSCKCIRAFKNSIDTQETVMHFLKVYEKMLYIIFTVGVGPLCVCV